MHTFYKQCARIILFVLCFNPMVQAAEVILAETYEIKKPSLSYKTIANIYLSSFNMQTQSENEGIVSEKDAKKPKLQLVPLSERDAHEIVFSTLDKYVQTKEQDIDNANMLTLAKDLEIYEKLLKEIKNTRTIFGTAVLGRMLAHPQTNVDFLQRKQAFIKELVNNNQLFNEIELILQKTEQAQDGLLSFWRQLDEPTREYLNSFYFTKPGFKNANADPKALEASVRLDNLGTVWKVFGDLAILFGVNYGMGKGMEMATRNLSGYNPQVRVMPYSLKRAFEDTGRTLNNFFNPYQYVKSYREIRNTDFYVDPHSPISSATARKIAYGGLAVIAAAATFYIAQWTVKTKGALDAARQSKNALNFMQTRLIDVASMISACDRLHSLAQENSVMANGLLYAPDFAQLDQPAIADLTGLLRTATFEGYASFFSYSGRILAAYKEFNEKKDYYAGALQALGEIDACMSIAKLYKKSQADRVGYCFVDFKKDVAPYMDLKGFWHPLIPTEVVVTNDLSLGKGAPSRNVILSGSNTGGKTTVLSAIDVSLLFAQTLTIAPAESVVITPFTFLGSYLYPKGDIAAGNSLFKAEVLRAQALMEHIQKLNADEYAFVIVDELFTGTAAEKGAAAAYKVANHLAQNPNVIYILATHFPLLTELEQATNGLCKNYMIDVIKQEDGTTVRPFKIEPGISSTSIANDLLQDALGEIDFEM